MMGRAKNWWYPLNPFLEKRPKSGMLTAMEENSPIMALSPVRAEKAVFMYVLVISTLPVTNGPPP